MERICFVVFSCLFVLVSTTVRGSFGVDIQASSIAAFAQDYPKSVGRKTVTLSNDKDKTYKNGRQQFFNYLSSGKPVKKIQDSYHELIRKERMSGIDFLRTVLGMPEEVVFWTIKYDDKKIPDSFKLNEKIQVKEDFKSLILQDTTKLKLVFEWLICYRDIEYIKQLCTQDVVSDVFSEKDGGNNKENLLALAEVFSKISRGLAYNLRVERKNIWKALENIWDKGGLVVKHIFDLLPNITFIPGALWPDDSQPGGPLKTKKEFITDLLKQGKAHWDTKVGDITVLEYSFHEELGQDGATLMQLCIKNVTQDEVQHMYTEIVIPFILWQYQFNLERYHHLATLQEFLESTRRVLPFSDDLKDKINQSIHGLADYHNIEHFLDDLGVKEQWMQDRERNFGMLLKAKSFDAIKNVLFFLVEKMPNFWDIEVDNKSMLDILLDRIRGGENFFSKTGLGNVMLQEFFSIINFFSSISDEKNYKVSFFKAIVNIIETELFYKELVQKYPGLGKEFDKIKKENERLNEQQQVAPEIVSVPVKEKQISPEKKVPGISQEQIRAIEAAAEVERTRIEELQKKAEKRAQTSKISSEEVPTEKLPILEAKKIEKGGITEITREQHELIEKSYPKKRTVSMITPKRLMGIFFVGGISIFLLWKLLQKHPTYFKSLFSR